MTMVEHEQDILWSQSGFLQKKKSFATAPSIWLTRVDSHLFRVLLSRRLRLLPLSSMRRSLVVGHHHHVFKSGGGGVTPVVFSGECGNPLQRRRARVTTNVLSKTVQRH